MICKCNVAFSVAFLLIASGSLAYPCCHWFNGILRNGYTAFVCRSGYACKYFSCALHFLNDLIEYICRNYCPYICCSCIGVLSVLCRDCCASYYVIHERFSILHRFVFIFFSLFCFSVKCSNYLYRCRVSASVVRVFSCCQCSK